MKWAQLYNSLNILWHCLSLGLEWKLTFSSPVATAEFFKNCWHIECSTLTASSFRIWNSSAGISSPPLALFIVMLPNAHLTLHSSMSASRWVTTPLWLSRSLRPFLYGSVYSCHLLISSASVRSLPFVIYGGHLFMKCSFGISKFLEENRVFPIQLFSSVSWHCSLKKAFLSLLAILWNSVFNWIYLSLSSFPFASLPFLAIFKASSDNHFAFLHFFLFQMVLVTTSHTRLWTSIRSSSGTLVYQI